MSGLLSFIWNSGDWFPCPIPFLLFDPVDPERIKERAKGGWNA